MQLEEVSCWSLLLLFSAASVATVAVVKNSGECGVKHILCDVSMYVCVCVGSIVILDD